MKGKYKIFNCIIALVVSVVVCIMICFTWVYGWFISSRNADVDTFHVGTEGADILGMTVNAYKLKNQTSTQTNGTAYVQYEIEGELSGLGGMNEYDMLDASVTAVLIEITYTINQCATDESKSFTLSLSCSKEQDYIITKDDVVLEDDQDDSYVCNLSYAVGFKFDSITRSGNTVTTTAEYDSSVTFATLYNNKYMIKNPSLTVKNAILSSTEEKTETAYILMDYSEPHINNLYTLLLEKGNAGLGSQFSFYDDITFILQEND